MSDEQHMEAAFRHADKSMRMQWHGMAPDEELMAREDGEALPDVMADLQEAFLCYCFADTTPEEWQTVATRAHVVMAMCFSGIFTLRPQHEIRGIRQGSRWVKDYPLAGMVREMMPHRELFGRVLLHYFPVHREWLKHGTQNLYLIARRYQQGLVTRWDGAEMTFEKLAVVFGEVPEDASEKDFSRARSRWSARAQNLLVRPIEAVGGNAGSVFGKGQGVREKYRKAQMGNQNRRKERSDLSNDERTRGANNQ